MPTSKKSGKRGKTEWYQKYRPTRWSQVVGQTMVNTLKTMISAKEVPNALLFTGPSGTGKTTAARILANDLKCSSFDFTELNAAGDRGIDVIKGLEETSRRSGLGGENRMWIIDEAHGLTKPAQQALLKVLEDSPPHAYFVLCTTEGSKLLTTVVNRCTVVTFQPLEDEEVDGLVRDVCGKERVKLKPDTRGRLVNAARGSARKALVILHQISHLKTEGERLEAIERADPQKYSIDLCRLLINPRTAWKEVAAVLRNLEDDPEMVRRSVLGYAKSVILKGGQIGRCLAIYDHMRDNFFDTGESGLIFACFRVISEK